MEFLIVSGLSGAGKSTVMSILEDSGFFCVDNLPPVLIPKFAEMCLGGAGTYEQVAMVCDIRGGKDFSGLFQALDTLREMQFDYKIVFVDAAAPTIIKRYKETRRAHPLMKDGLTLAEAVEQERRAMAPVRERAQYIITTTDLPSKKLRDQVMDLLLPAGKRTGELAVTVTSFGFKYGLPAEADLVFDVRFLPNPYYLDELRDRTGLEQDVRDYVFASGQTTEFLEKLEDLISFLLPHYREEGKSTLIVAVGCTGGRHRSVAVTHALAQFIQAQGYRVSENHRDMTRA